MDEKKWYQSKGVVAGLVTVIVGVLSLAGVGGLEGQKETLTKLILELLTALAGLAAIYGRVKATKKITK